MEMTENGFTLCALFCINRLREEGRHSTAHIYENALRSFTDYCGTEAVSYAQLNIDSLKGYARYLATAKLRPNTVSTYMRTLRAIYNRGIESGEAPYIHRLFCSVFTGVESKQKKALPLDELHTLLYEDPGSDRLRRTQDMARLLFLFGGMPFSDLAHLEKSDLQNGVIRYNRFKTGTPMSVEVLEAAGAILRRLRKEDAETGEEGTPDYLLNILCGTFLPRERAAHVEYQSALRRFNNQLKRLAHNLNLRTSVSSYSLRHSWATTAKFRGVPIEMISESLGHKSIRTTQIYLKSFLLEERTKVNRMNFVFVKKHGGVK